MLSAIAIEKDFGKHRALKGVSFELPAKGVTALLGPNGAGKTTLLRVLTCFHAPSAGTFTLDGVDGVDHPMKVKQRIGYLPEQGPLYPEMTVAENIRFSASLHGLRGAAQTAALSQSLERFGLGDRRHQLARNLSKGLRQRVALGAALSGKPALLVLDEPTSGLDPNQIAEFRNLLREIATETSVVLSSHILAEVEQACDGVLILHQGELVQSTDQGGLKALQGRGLRVRLAAAMAPGEVEKMKISLGLGHVQVDGLNLRVMDDRFPELTPQVVRYLVNSGFDLHEVGAASGALESLFRSLTQQEPSPPIGPAV